MEYSNHEISMDAFYNEDYQDLQDLSDAKLLTEDGYVFCIHKCLLTMKSWYFNVVFCKVDICITGILIPGIKGEILHEILSYIYTNNINFSQDNIADLLLTSDYLLLEDLYQKCEIYARYNIGSNNCLQLFSIAFLTNQNDLYRHSFRIMQIYFEKLARNANTAFDTIHVESLKKLLACRNLKGRDEDMMWNIIVRWVESKKSYRQMFVPDLLLYMNITNVDESLATKIVEHEIVKRNPWLKELTEIKATGLLNTNHEVLHSYAHLHYNKIQEISSYQWPASKLYLIQVEKFSWIYGDFDSSLEGRGLYITYDENINIWRKLTACNDYDYITSIREFIYGFVYFFSGSRLRFNRFNLIEKQWIEISYPIDVTWVNRILTHQELIYFLGCSATNMLECRRCFVYNPALNVWNEIESMTPVHSISAALYHNKIYVIGGPRRGRGIGVNMLQHYDPVYNKWNIFPFIDHRDYSLSRISVVADQLYVISEKLSTVDGAPYYLVVSVYDPVKSHWTVLPAPPVSFYPPFAINVNEQLFIYDFTIERRGEYVDKHPLGCPSKWNDYKKQWERVGDKFSRIQNYNIFAIDDRHSVEILSDENKILFDEFRETPFY